MRTLRPAGILAAGILIAAVSGCDQTPTAVKDYAAATALFSNSGQSKVELCHRTSSGDYAKITVSDAAYETHMAHGDRGVGPFGDCSVPSTWRLTLDLSSEVVLGPSYMVLVDHLFHLEPTCLGGETCHYNIPTGSTVMVEALSSQYVSYYVNWTPSEGCWDLECVMDRDRTAEVLTPRPQY